ncbi:organic hydroperoxide resistance protein [Arthrobacter sp. NPDC080073]|uniref:organic hydroperoxide resistance protein n=1 Tax=Arthrobacter sp. NPDC080073 TaxID=3155919 RepID=UPI0034317C6B
MAPTVYTIDAVSTGTGRDGRVRTTDGQLAFDMALPKAMGGSGEGVNPEQLFAAGYAVCFHSAMLAVNRGRGHDLTQSAVRARVAISSDGQGGYELAVDLLVVLPGLENEQATDLAQAAHAICPYSKATRGNISVTVGATGSMSAAMDAVPLLHY